MIYEQATDAGPTVITDPPALEELFSGAGKRMADYVELLPVSPFYRLCWEDGYSFDYVNDQAQLDRWNIVTTLNYLDHDVEAEIVAAKVQAALRHGLVPVICVGETLEQRDAGETLAVIANGAITLMAQIPASFDRKNPCIVTATSSGSRGVYGGIAVGGAWGLPRGCAVVHTDKGAGTDYFDAGSGSGVQLDGTRGAPGQGLAFQPAAAGKARAATAHIPSPSSTAVLDPWP